MFGYIRIAKPELRFKEYDLYKAVYCSLCRTVGRSYGRLTRLTLSYDFTFLALLGLSIQPTFSGVKKGRCVVNPLKKCLFCTETDAFEYPAAAAVIMLHYKLCDDVADEKGLSRLKARLYRAVFNRSYQKAKRRYGALDAIMAEYAVSQRAVEQNPNTDLDHAAEPTCRMLGRVFEALSDDKSQKRVLSRLGELLGRYIYLMDCACDAPKDRRSGAFNPLLSKPDEDILERVRPQIYWLIHEVAATAELLEVRRFKNVLDNILYVGLEDTMKKELKL